MTNDKHQQWKVIYKDPDSDKIGDLPPTTYADAVDLCNQLNNSNPSLFHDVIKAE